MNGFFILLVMSATFWIPPAVNGSRVVFLQHGAIVSSGIWLVNPANRSLRRRFVLPWIKYIQV